MDAIDRADIDTSRIFDIDAGLSNDIGHLFLLESDLNSTSKSISASQLKRNTKAGLRSFTLA